MRNMTHNMVLHVLLLGLKENSQCTNQPLYTNVCTTEVTEAGCWSELGMEYRLRISRCMTLTQRHLRRLKVSNVYENHQK